jgi:hypothetical protein
LVAVVFVTSKKRPAEALLLVLQIPATKHRDKAENGEAALKKMGID